MWPHLTRRALDALRVRGSSSPSSQQSYARVLNRSGTGKSAAMLACLMFEKDAVLISRLLSDGLPPDSRLRPSSWLLSPTPDRFPFTGLNVPLEVRAAVESDATPLMVASLKKNEMAVRVLVENGASVDARDLLGRTPLHHALDVPAPSVEIITYLLSKGANPHLADNSGKSAADLAQTKGGRVWDAFKPFVEGGPKTRRTKIEVEEPVKPELDAARLRSELDALRSQRDLDLRDRAAWVSTLERALSEQREQHTRESSELRSRVESAESKQTAIKSEVEHLRSRLEFQKNMVSALFERLKEARQSATMFKEGAAAKDMSAEAWKKEAQRLATKASGLERELEKAKGENEELRAKSESGHVIASAWVESWTEIRKEVEDGLRNQVKVLQESLSNLRKELAKRSQQPASQTPRSAPVRPATPISPPPATIADTFDPAEWLGALSLGGIASEEGPVGLAAAVASPPARPAPSSVVLATSPSSAIAAAPRSPPRAPIVAPSSPKRQVANVKGFFASNSNEELALASWPGLEPEPESADPAGLPELLGAMGIGALAHPAPSDVIRFEPQESTMIAIANALLDSAQKKVATGKPKTHPGRHGKAWIDLLGSSRLAAHPQVEAKELQVAPESGMVPKSGSSSRSSEGQETVVIKLREQLAKLQWALHSARSSLMRRIGELEDELNAVEARAADDLAQVQSEKEELYDELAHLREQLERKETQVQNLLAAQEAEDQWSLKQHESRSLVRSAGRGSQGELRKQLGDVIAHSDSLQVRLTAAQRKIEAAQDAISELSATLERRNAALLESQQESEDLRSRLADAAGEKLDVKQLFDAKTTLESERSLWMEIAQEQEGHIAQLKAELKRASDLAQLKDAQRLDVEVLRQRVVELDAKLARSEALRNVYKTSAETLQKTTFRLRAERDSGVPVAAAATATTTQVAPEPTVRVMEAPEPDAVAASETPIDSAQESAAASAAPPLELPQQIRSSRKNSLFDQLLSAEREISKNETMFRGSEVYDQVVANLNSQWTSFIYSILPPRSEAAPTPAPAPATRTAQEQEAEKPIVAVAEALVEEQPKVADKVEAAPIVEQSLPSFSTKVTIKSPVTELMENRLEQTVESPRVGFFSRLAQLVTPPPPSVEPVVATGQTVTEQVQDTIATSMVLEEMRLKQEAMEALERKIVRDTKTETKLRPQIKALQAENRKLWKKVTAASVVAKHSRFWKLHVPPKVAPDMAPLVAAAAKLRSDAFQRPDATAELAELERENAWLHETLRNTEVRNGLGQVVAEPVVKRGKPLSIDFVKNKVQIVQRTAPARLPEGAKIEFVKNKFAPVVDVGGSTALETALDKETTLDTEIRAETASEQERKDKKKDISEDVLLNKTSFEALLPTVAAKDEPIRIAETEKQEVATAVPRRGFLSLKLRRNNGWSPLAGFIARRSLDDAAMPVVVSSQTGVSEAVRYAVVAPSPMPPSESPNPAGFKSTAMRSSASVPSSPRSVPSRRPSPAQQPVAKASEWAAQVLEHGDLKDSERGALLVPLLKHLAGSPPPSAQRAAVAEADLDAGDIEAVMRRRTMSRIQSADLTAFLGRRRRIATQFSELASTYGKAYEEVKLEREQALDDFANSRLEMLESQFLFASTSSVASRTTPGASEIAHKEHIDRLSEKEQEILPFKRIAEYACRAVEDEIQAWSDVQAGWEADQAAEATEITAVIRRESSRLEARLANVKMSIPEEPLLAQRVALSNEASEVEAAMVVLRNHLRELGNVSAPGSPTTISRDSFSDIESDLVASFEQVHGGRSAILGSDGDGPEELSKSFFLLSSSLASRVPSQTSSK